MEMAGVASSFVYHDDEFEYGEPPY
jgi:hypothetical protein